jgi:hypothetical protein
MSYVLTSPSGLIVGFCFFLLLSAGIAFMIYGLMTFPSARRAELGLGTIRKSIAGPVAFAIWLALFSMIYVTSLAGFHTVIVDEEVIRLEYEFPPSLVTLQYADIGDVSRRPAFKLQWRLEITTSAGRTFESAPGSQRFIKAAAEEIQRRRGSVAAAASPR